MNPLETQVDGSHYKDMPIQPIEFSMANGLDACQHSILKYVCRFRSKGGIKDLEKARHFLDILIKLETDKAAVANIDPAACGVVGIAPKFSFPPKFNKPLAADVQAGGIASAAEQIPGYVLSADIQTEGIVESPAVQEVPQEGAPITYPDENWQEWHGSAFSETGLHPKDVIQIKNGHGKRQTGDALNFSWMRHASPDSGRDVVKYRVISKFIE